VISKARKMTIDKQLIILHSFRFVSFSIDESMHTTKHPTQYCVIFVVAEASFFYL
jgi:hypothetical protein